MGRKAARLAAKPHVVGSIALDERLRAAEATGDFEAHLDRVEGLKVHFKASGGVPPVTYDFGDGTTHTPSDGYNTAHTYAEPGEYDVTVVDAEGHEDDIHIELEPEPQVVPLAVRLDRVEGMKAHLKATDGVVPITYDFGDGKTHTPADGRDTAHTYAEPGEYEVTVTDSEGATATCDVTISEPEAQGSFPWDAMTTHAQIDGWVEAQLVARGEDWGQMTLASKRQWLVAYFDGATPWITGN